MNVEDQLRAAGRAVTEQVRELLPLALPAAAAPARKRWRRSPYRGARRSAWLVPIAAGAAIAAVAATLVALRDLPGTAHGPAGQPASSGSAATRPGPAVDPEALPKFFVALNGPAATSPTTPAMPTGLVIGETSTGKPVAMVSAQPSRSFDGVTGAADDRTFILSAVTGNEGMLQLTQPHSFYLLRLDPDTGVPQSLTKLPIPPTPVNAKVDGIALSSDGAKFAVSYQEGRPASFPSTGPFVLRVYAVATGALLHAWAGRDPNRGSPSIADGPPVNDTSMSWAADGKRLAFDFYSSSAPDASLSLRMVDLSRPGNDLFANSAVIAKIAQSSGNPGSGIGCETLGITADARTAVCGAELPLHPPIGATLDGYVQPAPWTGCAKPTDHAYPGLAEIALGTGRLTTVLYQVKPKCMGGGFARVLWASPSGSAVLGAIGYTDDPSMKEHTAVILVSHGKVTQLSWPGAAATLAFSRAAF